MSAIVLCLSRRDKMSVEICVFPPFFIRFFVQARKNCWELGRFSSGYRHFVPNGTKERKMADMLTYANFQLSTFNSQLSTLNSQLLMKIIITTVLLSLAFVACRTTKTAATATTTAATSPQPMHVTPATPLENTPSITSPLLIGTWELDTLVADGKAFPMSALPNKTTLQFTGTGLMVVKGRDEKDKFLTYTYKDSKITTLEDPSEMYVKTLNNRALVVLMKAEGKELRMVYKKK